MVIDILEAIVNTLESTVYIGDIPASPDNVCSITPIGGIPPDIDIEGKKTTEYYMFNIRVRDESYLNGYTRAVALANAVYNNSTELILFESSQVNDIGKDEKHRSEFTINISINIIP